MMRTDKIKAIKREEPMDPPWAGDLPAEEEPRTMTTPISIRTWISERLSSLRSNPMHKTLTKLMRLSWEETLKMLIHSPSNKWITTMSLLEVVDLSRIIREEDRAKLDHMEAITIDLIQILKLSEIQASLRTEETKKAIIIKTKNKTTRTMAAILIQSLSSSQRIQLLLRNRATSSTEIMMSRRKNQCLRSRNRKSSCLCMRMLEMIRMPLIMEELGMMKESSATLAVVNLLRRHLWNTVRSARRSSFKRERYSMSKRSEKKPYNKRWRTQITNLHIIRKRRLLRRQRLRNLSLLAQRQPSGRLRVRCSEQLCVQIVQQMMIPRDRLLRLWSKRPWSSTMIALSASGATVNSTIMQLSAIFQSVKRNIRSFRWRARATQKEASLTRQESDLRSEIELLKRYWLYSW